MSNEKIWIDTTSGTWGAVPGLVVVELNERNRETVLAYLDDASDSEISEFGLAHGEQVA
jgi:hypothetical protein